MRVEASPVQRLLSIEFDLGVAWTRAALLTQAGYGVISATSLQSMLVAASRDYDLVIVGRGLGTKQKWRVAAALKIVAPDVPVLEMCRLVPEIVDVRHYLNSDDPSALAAFVRELLEDGKAASA